MEIKHKCKLCFKSFSNGRALGGHMRSHMMNLPIPPKATHDHHHDDDDDDDDDEDDDDDPHHHQQLGEEIESASMSSAASSSEEEQTPPPYVAATEGDDEEEDKGVYYGLRENPRKSFLLADPEFSFAASVVLQDRESETESSKNPTRRRSKRTRKSAHLPHPNHKHTHTHAHTQFKPGRVESGVAEAEPVSSISDATTEEDVAFCLMMLSRDQWSSTRNHHQQQQQRVDSEELEELEYETQQQLEEAEEGEDDEEEETDGFESDEAMKTVKINKSGRGGKYKCETCKKVFRSYQALGGHRASHKKVKLCSEPSRRHGPSSVNAATADEPRSHECPVCFRVFASGQALGGHKRSHLAHSAAAPPPAPPPPATATQSKSSGRCGDNLSLIDLNLPAPMDDDDLSQVELSAVSDAEFVNSFRR